MSSVAKERRPWTSEEDYLLRAAVETEEPGNRTPSKWFAIATHVPGRTNKDCRKRWFARMAADIVRGVWSAEEDAKLMSAVAKYGTKWSLVASMVHSRNSDQCAKRWTDTLDPTIDRSGWSLEQDQILLEAVDEHGTCWKKIVRTYFPGKTGLSAKNRYASLTRIRNARRLERCRSADGDMHSSSFRASLSSHDKQTPFYSPPPKHTEALAYSMSSPSSYGSESSDWESSAEPYTSYHHGSYHGYPSSPEHQISWNTNDAPERSYFPEEYPTQAYSHFNATHSSNYNFDVQIATHYLATSTSIAENAYTSW